MAVDSELIRHLAELNRIRLTDEEELKVADDLGRIIDYIGILGELDGAVSDGGEATDITELREDRAVKCDKCSQLLGGAPVTRDGFFAVKKAVK